MKIYQILIFGLLLAFISSTCTALTGVSSLKDCGKLDDSEKKAGLTHCCYSEAGSIKACSAIDQDAYDSIKKSKGSTTVGGVTYKYECYVSYLKFGIINLLIASFWL